MMLGIIYNDNYQITYYDPPPSYNSVVITVSMSHCRDGRVAGPLGLSMLDQLVIGRLSPQTIYTVHLVVQSESGVITSDSTTVTTLQGTIGSELDYTIIAMCHYKKFAF